MNAVALTFYLVTKFEDVFKIYQDIFHFMGICRELLNTFYGTGMFIFGSNDSSKPDYKVFKISCTKLPGSEK